MTGDGTFKSGWSEYPIESQDEHPARTEVGDDGEMLGPDSAAPVVGLGAICGLMSSGVDDDARSQSFWVSEFARLANSRRVILHEERGFTIGEGSGDGRVQDCLTRDIIADNVRNVVLPDVDDGEDHPWTWLAELARARGVNVTAEELRGLPYEVVFTDDLIRWLAGS